MKLHKTWQPHCAVVIWPGSLAGIELGTFSDSSLEILSSVSIFQAASQLDVSVSKKLQQRLWIFNWKFVSRASSLWIYLVDVSMLQSPHYHNSPAFRVEQHDRTLACFEKQQKTLLGVIKKNYLNKFWFIFGGLLSSAASTLIMKLRYVFGWKNKLFQYSMLQDVVSNLLQWRYVVLGSSICFHVFASCFWKLNLKFMWISSQAAFSMLRNVEGQLQIIFRSTNGHDTVQRLESLVITSNFDA